MGSEQGQEACSKLKGVQGLVAPPPRARQDVREDLTVPATNSGWALLRQSFLTLVLPAAVPSILSEQRLNDASRPWYG